MKKILSALVLVVVIATAYAIKVDEVEFPDATKMATAASGADTGRPHSWRLYTTIGDNISCGTHSPLPMTTNANGTMNPEGCAKHYLDDKIAFGQSSRFTTNKLYLFLAYQCIDDIQSGYRADLSISGTDYALEGYAPDRYQDFSGEVGISYGYMHSIHVVRGTSTNAAVWVYLNHTCSSAVGDSCGGYFTISEM
jgi:hypothetical protein